MMMVMVMVVVRRGGRGEGVKQQQSQPLRGIEDAPLLAYSPGQYQG